MAKHKSGGEAAEAGKRRPQKKVASRPGPRNRPSKPARAAKAKPGKPARSARPRREPGKPVEPTQVELPIDDIADALDLDLDVDAEDAQGIEDADILAETPAEAGSAELSTLYGDDLAAPAIAHGEYADRQTADEDRPMVPEINARDERKAQWQERRDRRRRRRDERDRQRLERRGDHQQRHEPRPQEARPERTQHARIAAEPRQPYQPGGRPQGALAAAAPAAPAAAPTNGEPQDALARVGTPLGDAAAQVFAQLRNGQPLPVRQLAAMMRKRSLVETDPEQ
ncbi:MAG: hypothetical protein E6J91_21680, partial [Deltaproteobacteria bacterium]